MRTLFFLFFTIASVSGFCKRDVHKVVGNHPFGWNQISVTAKPSCFWWWMGSSVNEAEIERQLIMLKNAGFGGVTICPLYGYENPTVPPIKFLSSRWDEVLKFTLSKARDLDMLCDITTGAGWPIGGNWVTKDNGERDWRLEVLNLNPTSDHPVALSNEAGKDPIKCVTLLKNSIGAENFDVKKEKDPAQVIEPTIENGNPVWHLPGVGKCKILVARMGYTDFKVYVASEVNKGLVFDYYSPEAFKNLTAPIDEMFHKMGDLHPRAVYCDSYEGRIGTTPEFFETFRKYNGYEIQPYMHQFLSESGTPENVRLWHDYRATIAFLHLEFVKRWTKWANQYGIQTRYQYTGDPANPINTCGAADIPEDDPPYNTSAAHIFGKKLISCEAYTWGLGGNNNFIDYLDFYRKKGDGMVMEGLNHKIYHGVPFTPQSEPWPGPMYYAGGNFSETQPFFKHIRYLNEYFARLQHILQESTPNTDILMLWSIHDYWNDPNVGGFNWKQPFVWRNSNSAIELGGKAVDTRSELIKRGLQTDFCSDEVILEKTSVENGIIKAGVANYKLLVIPETKMIAAKALEKLEQLARDGATIIFMKQIPLAEPKGLPLIQDMSQSNRMIQKMAKNTKSGKGGVYMVSNTQELLGLLHTCGLTEEGISDKLTTFRVKSGNRTTYLIRNNAEDYLDIWVPLSHFNKNSTQIIVGNPRTGELSSAEHRMNPDGRRDVHLVLNPTELITVTEANSSENQQNIKPFDYRIKKRIKPIDGKWKLSWVDYDGTQHHLLSDTLKLWTEIPEIGMFSGLVDYETNFTLKGDEVNKPWFLDGGKVLESAEVFINGKCAGCIWTTPFQLGISKFLKIGINTLWLEVVNKAQNRVIDMFQKGTLNIKCKKNDLYHIKVELFKPVPSGLLGPVQLRCAE